MHRLLAPLLVLLTGLFSGSAAAGDRNIIGDPVESPVESSEGRSYALVIGINEYDDGAVFDLKGAKSDAKAVSQVLQEQGFEVIPLFDEDANLQAIQDTLKLTLYKVLNRQDRLVVYFAGHGISRPNKMGDDEGYLLPVDGDSKNPFNMLSMTDLVRIFNQLPAQQILYLADACHSGLAQETRKSGADGTDMVRVIMTAGTADQVVEDNYKGHGLYTYFFLEGIRGKADFNHDGRVTSSELHAYTQGEIEPIAEGRQTPTHSKMGAGDFVFRAGDGRAPSTVEGTQAARGVTQEVAYFDYYVLNRGVLYGTGPLTEEETHGRWVSYKFESKNDRVQTVTRINGAHQPTPDEGGISQWVHVYGEGGTGDIAELVELNRLGQVVKRRHYSEAGASRVDFRDRFGKITRTWQILESSGFEVQQAGRDVYGKGYTYDARGFVEREWYISYDPLRQVRRLGEDGTWGWRYERNEAGQDIRKFPLDVDGQDAISAKGITQIEYRYNSRGYWIEEAVYGRAGELILNEDGVARVTYEKDEQGKALAESYFDAAGNPTLSTDGFAKVTWEYDLRGNPVKLAYFGTDGQPVRSSQGFAFFTKEFDEMGNKTATTYYGTDGELVLDSTGVARKVYGYDELGTRVQARFFGTGGNPTENNDGYAGWTSTFDAKGNETSTAFFGVDDNPTENNDGYAGWTSTFDAKGNKTGTAFFGVDGYPTENKDAVAGWTFTFNAKGNKTGTTYFDVDGNPTENDDGYAGLRWTFENGNEVRRVYLGVDGKPKRQKDGCAGWTQSFNESGDRTERANIDIEPGQLCADKNGIARVQYRYDAMGNAIEEAYFDVDGNPTPDETGVSIERTKWKDGNLIEIAHFDGKGNPVGNSDGVAIFTTKYDARRNLVEVAYLNKRGKPVVVEGCECTQRTMTYNARGLETERVYSNTWGKAEPWIQRRYKTYDTRGHILRAGIHLTNGLQGELAYDERGRVQSVQFHHPELGMGTPFVKTYDEQGVLLGLHLISPEGQEVPLDGPLDEELIKELDEMFTLIEGLLK